MLSFFDFINSQKQVIFIILRRKVISSFNMIIVKDTFTKNEKVLKTITKIWNLFMFISVLFVQKVQACSCRQIHVLNDNPIQTLNVSAILLSIAALQLLWE